MIHTINPPIIFAAACAVVSSRFTTQLRFDAAVGDARRKSAHADLRGIWTPPRAQIECPAVPGTNYDTVRTPTGRQWAPRVRAAILKNEYCLRVGTHDRQSHVVALDVEALSGRHVVQGTQVGPTAVANVLSLH